MTDERIAKQGEKMIEIRVRFWTDSIAATKGQIRPKHAWSGGVVMMQRNPAHSISPKNPAPFNNMAELPDVIERGRCRVDVNAGRRIGKRPSLLLLRHSAAPFEPCPRHLRSGPRKDAPLRSLRGALHVLGLKPPRGCGSWGS